jgi:hypothetical protein
MGKWVSSQVCLLFVQVLLACNQVMSFCPSQLTPYPLNKVIFVYIESN